MSRTGGEALFVSAKGKYADLITFSRMDNARQSRGGEVAVSYGKNGTAKIHSWGKGNTLPYDREMLIRDNNISPQLIATKRSILIGSGPIAYTKRFEKGKEIRDRVEIPTEANEFFELLEENGYWGNAAKNLLMHGGPFTEYLSLIHI